MEKLDEKDKKIITILMGNGREKLTNIARKVGLSIDATNNRIKKMLDNEVFNFGIYINPQKIGYGLTANAWIKLHNLNEEEYNKFINYLTKHPRITTLLSITGDYDLNAVIMVKDNVELEKVSRDIRSKFSSLIADWKLIFVVKVHKFEWYDLEYV